jgi:hypothetical protein
MRHRRLTAAVLTAVSGLAIAGLLAGPANASTVAPSQTAPAATPVTASPTPTSTPSSSLVSATVTAVDAKTGVATVVVTVLGKNVTLHLNANTAAVINGVKTTLAGAKVGTTVQLGSSSVNAAVDPSKLLQLIGSLAKVDAKAGTVSVKTGTETKTLPVSTDAKITLDGVTAKLADLATLPATTAVSVSGQNTANGGIVTNIEAKRVKSTPTASPTATATPKATPTATTAPKTTPTETPKTTPTATATVTPKATPTATPKATEAPKTTPTASKGVTVKASVGAK